MGKTPTLDPSDETVLKAMGIILKETRERGLIAGVHTDGPKTAHKRFEEGFQFCTLLNDVRLLATAAANAVREARGLGAAAACEDATGVPSPRAVGVRGEVGVARGEGDP